jgi:asparagine synthase (glutamine-hydrolysing)
VAPVIAGLLYRGEASHPSVAHGLERLAGLLGSSGPAVSVPARALGFATSPPGLCVRGEPQIWVAADADLTNRDDLVRLTGIDADDGTLIAALYARRGTGFLHALHGAFAVAVWDGLTETLVLGVDRFNIRRLYYAVDGNRLAFAPRPGLLRAIVEVAARPDPTAVYEYLNFGYVPGPRSIFAGIERLAPGHRLTVRRDGPSVEPYWQMTYPEGQLSRASTATTLYRLTERAVADAIGHTPPDKVGAFLSGGTDSSTVVGLLSRSLNGDVNAFSIGFREDEYDELRYARIAANHFQARHHTRIVTADDALEWLPRLVDAFDEPLGNNSAIGTAACAGLARDLGVDRLLAGDGGDEIFGGNERYRTDRVFGSYHLVPAPLRRGLIEPVLLGLPAQGGGLVGRAQRYIRRANLPNPERFYSYEFYFAREGQRLLAEDFRRSVDPAAPHGVLDTHYRKASATSELNRLLYLDLQLTIGDNDLLKVTRTAELAGVQVRFPLLDPKLVDFTGTWPARFKVRGFEKRSLFKRAFGTLLPPAILGKRKQGFGVPTGAWLRHHARFKELARDMLLAPRAGQRGYFRPGAVEELLERHATDPTPYFGDLLWRLLMLELWHRRHGDRPSAG